MWLRLYIQVEYLILDLDFVHTVAMDSEQTVQLRLDIGAPLILW